jgi:hypothetical protein
MNYQEPLFLRCLGGPKAGEELATHRRVHLYIDANDHIAGVYVREDVRGGAAFQWYIPGEGHLMRQENLALVSTAIMVHFERFPAATRQGSLDHGF